MQGPSPCSLKHPSFCYTAWRNSTFLVCFFYLLLIHMPHFAHERFVSADGLCPSLFNAFLKYKNSGFLPSKFCGFMNLPPKTPGLSYFKKNMLSSCTLFKEMSQFGICLHICSHNSLFPLCSLVCSHHSNLQEALQMNGPIMFTVHTAVSPGDLKLASLWKMGLKHSL